ncbi:M1 family aminopeptidase [Bacillus sp. JJ1609]|uniref:M1 family aminopeptidase n=1 Tax=Bacillus sp. JJ1609 TaxID=3122977 RepID=UPI002FFF0876
MRKLFTSKLVYVLAIIAGFLRNLYFKDITTGFKSLFKNLGKGDLKTAAADLFRLARDILIKLIAMFVFVFKYIHNLKHRNMIVGFAILFIFFLISWTTELMPESNEPLIFDENGKFVAAPPAPPSFVFPLGTDLGARSMVNLVLVGVKYTLGAVIGITLARLILGGVLALLTAIWLPGFKRYFSAFFWPFRYIPALLAGIILMLPIAAAPQGYSAKVILEYQVLVLILIGLPGVFYFITDMVEEIKKEPFVLSSTLMGGGKLHILVRHVWPNIKSHFLLLTAQQMLQLLQLLTFMGIFAIYLGGPHPTAITDSPRLIYRSISNELAGMAGQNYWLIRRAPWMAYSPILIITVIALIINWIKRGIEDQIAGVIPVKQKSVQATQSVFNPPLVRESKSFVLVGSQREAVMDYKKKIYFSDIFRNKLITLRRYFLKFRVYKAFEKFLLKMTSFIGRKPKPVLTALLTLPLILWAGVYGYAQYQEYADSTKEQTAKQSSVQVSSKLDRKEIYHSDFTNKDVVPTDYKAYLTYNEAEGSLQGTLNVTMTNTTGKEQDQLYFHLYPNQFQEPLEGIDWEMILGPSPEPGWIEIKDLYVNSKRADFKVDKTILEIDMDNWTVKQKAEVAFKFTLKLPKNYSNTSFDYAAVWLGNFLPTQAVYDKNGWNLDPLTPFGNPFYREIANYDITLTAPAKYEIVSNAPEPSAKIETQGDTVKYAVKLENVRDLSLVLLDKQYYSREIFMTDDTMINIWSRPTTDDQEAAQRNNMAAGQSMKYFEEYFGTYPYKELDIIRTAESSPQMSYQGMIFTPGYNFTNHLGSISMADAVLRQWLSGAVGSNGYKEPWVNEGITSYLLKKFMAERGYGSSKSADQIAQMQTEIARVEAEGQYLSSPLGKFNNMNDYSVLISGKGTDMYVELEKLIGTGKFRNALKQYAKENTNKNASGYDLIKAFEAAGGVETSGYFENWLKPDKKE